MAHSPSRLCTSTLSRFFALGTTAFLVALTLLTTGCHKSVTDPHDPKFIVAEKGNWQITRGQLDAEISSFLKSKQMTPEQVGAANMPKLETGMLDNMVIQKLLLAKAATMQLKDVDKEEATTMDRLKARYPTQKEFDDQLKASGFTLDELKQKIHDKIVIGKVMEAEALHDDNPTEAEIDQIYLTNKAAFSHPPKVRASRILIMVDEKATPAEKAAKKKAIDKARARVMKGEDFSKVAMEVSEDQYSKARGGDINFFQQGENEAGFDEVAFKTKEGEVSPVFETALGYQFLKVTATQPAETAPVADARAFIADKLRQNKMMQQEKDYTAKLLADGGVTFYLVRVDLNPSPAPGSAPAPGAAPQGAPAVTPTGATTTAPDATPAK